MRLGRYNGDVQESGSNPRESGRSDGRKELDGPPKSDFYGDYDDNGVDLSLLRYMLRLSPLERLKAMERHARDIQILYECGQRHRKAQAAPNR